MSELGLTAGVIEYHDTGGDGPVVVLLHGVAMDGSLWDEVVAGPVPHATMDRWFRPLQTSPEIRRDLRAYVLGVPERAELLRWAEQLRTFDRPALVIWATEDRVMPLDHGRRLAELLPQGRLVEVADSYTLIPQDRPDALVEHIGAFLAETA
ncbi:alpha/beta fold hydrolase [Streptomyces anulatus]